MFLSKKSVTFAVSALAMLCSGAAFAKEAPQALIQDGQEGTRAY